VRPCPRLLSFSAVCFLASVVSAHMLTPLAGSGTANDPYALSERDPYGVPALEPEREVYSQAFRQDVVASLPERGNLVKTRPQLVQSSVERNLVFLQDAEVRVSFVHEGAGYRNVVGVFPFPTATPPQHPSEVEHSVVFPNASFRNSGGNLRMGDTAYVGSLSQGTSLGFWLSANGYKGEPTGPTAGKWTLYSIDDLNPAEDPALRRQTILLRDPDAQRFVIAFEDISRDRGGDQDFNDVILTVQVTPYSAVDTTGIPDLVLAQDVDSDGVSNSEDAFPDDPLRAYRVDYPGEGVDGTLAFEDLWPFRGDYDFNDLVVSYHVTHSHNAAGKVVDVTCTYKVLARGAAYHNGLRVRLPVPRADVASVTRRFDAFAEEPVELREEQALATAEAFADAHQMIHSAPGSLFANTDTGTPRIGGRQVALRFEFGEPVDPALFGEAPYDTFLFRGGVEVHLPGEQPTESIDSALIGTGDDATQPGTTDTFRTPWGQAWVLRIPRPWKHPSEKRSIELGYRSFVPWTVSGGQEHQDWFERPEADSTIWSTD
jgi:LruC domain-containing protein